MVGYRPRGLNDQGGAIDTLAGSIHLIHVDFKGVLALCLRHVGNGVDEECKQIRLTVDIKLLVDRLSMSADGF